MAAKTKAGGVTAAQLRKMALSFPGVEEGSSYGQPSFLFRKKFFTRLRKEDNSVVLIVDSMDERDMLLESDPATFFITEHYRNYPSVLVRLERVDGKVLQGMLERRWRMLAPKKMQMAANDSGAGRKK